MVTCREAKCELGMRDEGVQCALCNVHCAFCTMQPCKGLRLRLIRVSKLQGQRQGKVSCKGRTKA